MGWRTIAEHHIESYTEGGLLYGGWTVYQRYEDDMPGKGHRFTAKQDRQAKHVAASERAKGMSAKEAKSVGYATVNANKKKSKRGSRY